MPVNAFDYEVLRSMQFFETNLSFKKGMTEISGLVYLHLHVPIIYIYMLYIYIQWNIREHFPKNNFSKRTVKRV